MAEPEFKPRQQPGSRVDALSYSALLPLYCSHTCWPSHCACLPSSPQQSKAGNLSFADEFMSPAWTSSTCHSLLYKSVSFYSASLYHSHFTERTSLFLSKTCILAPSHPIPPPRGLSPSRAFSLRSLLAFLTHHVSMICSCSKCVFQEALLCWEKFLEVF